MNPQDFDNQITPFKWLEHDNSFSVILSVGEYKHAIFESFEDDGFEGSGYDWANLADVFLQEQLPELEGIVKFDPEGSMFSAYSDNQQALQQFILAFKAMCDDDNLMLDVLSRTEPD